MVLLTQTMIFVAAIGVIALVHRHRLRTTRRAYDATIRQHDERFELLIKATETPIWDWDVTRDVLWCNTHHRAQFGTPASERELTRAWWESRIHPADVERVVKGLERTLESSIRDWSVEYRAQLADGSYGPVLDRIFISRGDDGAPRRVLGSLVDLAEREEIRHALTRAADEAEAANASKAEFLANMSHEIRTPMTAILGYADLLSDVREDPVGFDRHLETIRRNGRNLLAIINDILDLSKIEAGRMRIDHSEMSISRVIAEVVSLMRVRAQEKGIALEVEYTYPIPSIIHSDAVRVRQVVMNIVGNAIKFTDEGTVHVTVSLVDHEDDPKISVAVADTGIGMTRDEMDRLFRPFVQADTTMSRRHGGTGLGLGISRRLARMLGGDITFESERGRGSTFVATFATGSIDGVEMIGHQREAGPTESSARGARGEQPLAAWRVLLVEDGPDNQRLIRFHLRKMGALVEVAENGLEGFEKALGAEESNEPFDLVLMDMQMPVLDGYQATARLRAQGYDRPIVALTAHAMSGDRERCLDAGCDEYSTKPIDRDDLLRAIDRARSLRANVA